MLLELYRACARLGRRLVFRHCEPGLLCKVVHCVHEAERRVLHQEADRIAMRAAAETVIRLARWTDREARRLLAMKRTKAFVIDACLSQLDLAPDDFDDVDARKQLLDERRRDHRGSLAPAFCTTGRPPRKSNGEFVELAPRRQSGFQPFRLETAAAPGFTSGGIPVFRCDFATLDAGPARTLCREVRNRQAIFRHQCLDLGHRVLPSMFASCLDLFFQSRFLRKKFLNFGHIGFPVRMVSAPMLMARPYSMENPPAMARAAEYLIDRESSYLYPTRSSIS